MPDGTHRFRIGAVDCIALNDGTFPYPANFFFSNVSEERLEQELRDRRLPLDHVLSPYTCLLINTGEKRVLVDTGAANLAPTTGKLLSQLETEGIKAADIDTVILTHGHPDHISGAVDAGGNPVFVNARYVMWKSEWDFWTAAEIDLSAMPLPEEIRNSIILSARRCLPRLEERLELLDRETEIAPGVTAIPAPGHTPGHMAVSVSSGRELLLYLADAVLHPLHLERPEWRNAFDLMPEQAAETRGELLDQAAADRATVLAFHFPFPSLGHVAARGREDWQWEPV